MEVSPLKHLGVGRASSEIIAHSLKVPKSKANTFSPPSPPSTFFRVYKFQDHQVAQLIYNCNIGVRIRSELEWIGRLKYDEKEGVTSPCLDQTLDSHLPVHFLEFTNFKTTRSRSSFTTASSKHDTKVARNIGVRIRSELEWIGRLKYDEKEGVTSPCLDQTVSPAVYSWDIYPPIRLLIR
jgi:hypothetical protein